MARADDRALIDFPRSSNLSAHRSCNAVYASGTSFRGGELDSTFDRKLARRFDALRLGLELLGD